MRFWTIALLAAAFAFGVGPTSAHAQQPFLPGNLAIYRVGDGTTGLTNTGSPVFIDEYSITFSGTGDPTSAALRQSIALPTLGSTGTNTPFPLIASGTATSEGLMTLSTDGKSLLIPGYGTTTGGGIDLTGTSAGAVPRVVGIVGFSGAVDTRSAFSDWATGNNPRGVASTNGTDLWFTGAGGGVRHATASTATTATPATSTQLSTTVTNLRSVQINNGQLFVSGNSGTAVRVGTVGTGLPTTSGQTITNLPGFPTTGSPYAFAVADLSPAVAGVDTLYVADDTGATGGLQKYSLVGGNWTLNGTFGAGSAIRGLTATVTGSNVTLFATTGGSTGTGGGTLFGVQDTAGYNAPFSSPTLTTLATAGANTAFRGVAFTPVPEPTAVLAVCGAGFGAAAWLRRRVRKTVA